MQACSGSSRQFSHTLGQEPSLFKDGFRASQLAMLAPSGLAFPVATAK